MEKWDFGPTDSPEDPYLIVVGKVIENRMSMMLVMKNPPSFITYAWCKPVAPNSLI